MAEDDDQLDITDSLHDVLSEEEDEYDLEQRQAIGSGVEIDLEADYVETYSHLSPDEDATVDDVVEEAEEKKPDEPQKQEREAECVATCGADGMMLVDAAQDSWPRDLSLYVLRCMYDVPLPEHAECLAVDALLRMLSLDFEVEEPANVEYMSPSGRAPFIKCGRQLVSELDPILHHLSRKGVSLSGDLTEEDTHRQERLWSLVQCTLSAAELRVCWLHPKTRDTLTEPQVVGRYPWPLSTIIGRRKRNEALSWLTAREPSSTTASDLELSLDTVYKQVDDVCSTLSTELGGAPYFFGEEATELEAMIYGHLFLLLTVPVPVGEHTSLSQVIQEYPNLVSLVARMDDEVFGRDLGIFLTS